MKFKVGDMVYYHNKLNPPYRTFKEDPAIILKERKGYEYLCRFILLDEVECKRNNNEYGLIVQHWYNGEWLALNEDPKPLLKLVLS